MALEQHPFRPRVDRGGPIDSSLLREGVRSFVYSKHPYRSHWDRRGPIRSQQSRIRRCVTKGVALESEDMCKEEENAKTCAKKKKKKTCAKEKKKT